MSIVFEKPKAMTEQPTEAMPMVRPSMPKASMASATRR